MHFDWHSHSAIGHCSRRNFQGIEKNKHVCDVRGGEGRGDWERQSNDGLLRRCEEVATWRWGWLNCEIAYRILQARQTNSKRTALAIQMSSGCGLWKWVNAECSWVVFKSGIIWSLMCIMIPKAASTARHENVLFERGMWAQDAWADMHCSTQIETSSKRVVSKVWRKVIWSALGVEVCFKRDRFCVVAPNVISVVGIEWWEIQVKIETRKLRDAIELDKKPKKATD